jgi:hypothetical protein
MEFKPGDGLYCSGNAWSSLAIKLATYGRLSHVATIADYEGRLLVFESTTDNRRPCVIRGVPCKGVQAQPLTDWINHYDGRVWHYPLARQLAENESRRLTDYFVGKLGLGYDYIGAIRAGGEGLSWIESKLRQTDLHSLFCSELRAGWLKLFKRLEGKRSLSSFSPNKLARVELRDGISLAPVELT